MKNVTYNSYQSFTTDITRYSKNSLNCIEICKSEILGESRLRIQDPAQRIPALILTMFRTEGCPHFLLSNNNNPFQAN
jgi:hypothetical protein